MTFSEWFIILLTLSEVGILVLIFYFFIRLKNSEVLLEKLQGNQSALLERLQINAQLEQDLVQTFQKRQAELVELDERLEARREDLAKILRQAEEFSRSPQFLRQVILAGHRKGESSESLAKTTGLSVDEVELIIEQSNLL